VVKVGGAMEEVHIAHRLDGCGDLIYHFWSPGFGKVGNTFDERVRHGV